jgi:hypothetical protein
LSLASFAVWSALSPAFSAGASAGLFDPPHAARAIAAAAISMFHGPVRSHSPYQSRASLAKKVSTVDEQVCLAVIRTLRRRCANHIG